MGHPRALAVGLVGGIGRGGGRTNLGKGGAGGDGLVGGVQDRQPPLEAALLSTGGRAADRPGAPEVGGVTVVVAAGVHPDEVALGVDGVARPGGEGQMPGGGAGAVGHAPGHGLEDDVDHVGVDALFSEAAEEHGCQFAAAHAGDQGFLHGGHGPASAGLGLVDAGQLVDGLAELDRAHGVGGVGDLGGRQHAGAAHGPGHQIDADPPAAGVLAEDGVELGAEVGGALVDVGPHRRMGIDVEAIGIPTQKARLGLVGEHHSHRTVGRGVGGVDPLGNAVGGVGHVRGVEQHQGIEPVDGHLELQLGVAIPPQPLHVELKFGSGAGVGHGLSLWRCRLGDAVGSKGGQLIGGEVAEFGEHFVGVLANTGRAGGDKAAAGRRSGGRELAGAGGRPPGRRWQRGRRGR